MEVIQYDEIEKKIILIRGQKVIIDSDVAELYGVDTKNVNQAVNRNPNKFLQGYIFELTMDEKIKAITNCDNLQKLKFSPSLPKAFCICWQ